MEFRLCCFLFPFLSCILLRTYDHEMKIENRKLIVKGYIVARINKLKRLHLVIQQVIKVASTFIGMLRIPCQLLFLLPPLSV